MWGAIISIIAVLCAIWVIYDVFTNQKKLSNDMKVIWTVFAIVFSIITAIVYYFVKKK
jgi:hypothetical protein